jgi:hypothetical protein
MDLSLLAWPRDRDAKNLNEYGNVRDELQPSEAVRNEDARSMTRPPDAWLGCLRGCRWVAAGRWRTCSLSCCSAWRREALRGRRARRRGDGRGRRRSTTTTRRPSLARAERRSLQHSINDPVQGPRRKSPRERKTPARYRD